jgi:hypothetical protein
MPENRSFDHMLGLLYSASGNVSPTGQPFEGLTRNEPGFGPVGRSGCQRTGRVSEPQPSGDSRIARRAARARSTNRKPRSLRRPLHGASLRAAAGTSGRRPLRPDRSRHRRARDHLRRRDAASLHNPPKLPLVRSTQSCRVQSLPRSDPPPPHRLKPPASL